MRFCDWMALGAFWTILVNGDTEKDKPLDNAYGGVPTRYYDATIRENTIKPLITLSLLVAPTDATVNSLKLPSTNENDVTTEPKTIDNMNNNRNINYIIKSTISRDEENPIGSINVADNRKKLLIINNHEIPRKLIDLNSVEFNGITIKKVSSELTEIQKFPNYEVNKKNSAINYADIIRKREKFNSENKKNVDCKMKIKLKKFNGNDKVLKPPSSNNSSKFTDSSLCDRVILGNSEENKINDKKINPLINQTKNNKKSRSFNAAENQFVKRDLRNNNSSTSIINESLNSINKTLPNSSKSSIFPIKLNFLINATKPQNFKGLNKQSEPIVGNSDKTVTSMIEDKINHMSSRSFIKLNETRVNSNLQTVLPAATKGISNSTEIDRKLSKKESNKSADFHALRNSVAIQNASSFSEIVLDDTNTPSSIEHSGAPTNRDSSNDSSHLFYEDEVTASEFYSEFNATYDQINEGIFIERRDATTSLDDLINGEKTENSNAIVNNDINGINNTDGENSTRLTLNQWPVKHSAVVEGDLVLGGLMMVHEREDTVTCGPVMPQGGVQALEAMLYTLDWLNKREIVPGVKIGAHILDDCDKDTYGLEMAVDFIKETSRGFT